MIDSKIHKKTVLVVDDEDLVLSVVRELIRLLGYNCVTAEDGIQAMEVMHQSSPDLILLDFYLPNMPGEQILESMIKEYPQSKVIMASGRELSAEEKRRLTKKGVHGFLYKPYTVDDLERLFKIELNG